MLTDIDVELYTWARTPNEFNCHVGFVLTATYLAVIQGGATKIRVQACSMSQRWFPKVEPSFAEITLFAESKLKVLSRVVLTKPSPALNAGDHVVVMTGDWKDSTGRIKGVADLQIVGKRVGASE
jgi:hypothetical protein